MSTYQISQSDEPPYPPKTAYVGGHPTPHTDIPICAVFIFLFALAIPVHLALKRATKFPAVLIVVFCTLRIVSLVMRIAWALHPNQLRVEIAAATFALAGVVLLYVLNLILSRRFVRDYAIFGYRPSVKGVYRFGIFIIVACLIMAVIVSSNTYFTRAPDILQECRDILLAVIAILTVMAFVPVITVLVVWFFADEEAIDREKTRFKRRVTMLVVTSLLLTLEAGFRCGTLYAARPVGREAWFNHRAAYYCLGFLLEILVVYLLVAVRFGHGFDLGGTVSSKMLGGAAVGKRSFLQKLRENVDTEEDVFGRSG
ncbi:hypothetical protein QBC35DRAFT_550998 [Podospora australis]|uniref:Uncharacterized protein n=1 Tax=Podospora australis TaxID=1536484 RepID=A0AAN6WTI1_9PEZI|nr:hypothetical protein QBC35DRAFT_550998 [Podospora australis]